MSIENKINIETDLENIPGPHHVISAVYYTEGDEHIFRGTAFFPTGKGYEDIDSRAKAIVPHINYTTSLFAVWTGANYAGNKMYWDKHQGLAFELEIIPTANFLRTMVPDKEYDLVVKVMETERGLLEKDFVSEGKIYFPKGTPTANGIIKASFSSEEKLNMKLKASYTALDIPD